MSAGRLKQVTCEKLESMTLLNFKDVCMCIKRTDETIYSVFYGHWGSLHVYVCAASFHKICNVKMKCELHLLEQLHRKCRI